MNAMSRSVIAAVMLVAGASATAATDVNISLSATVNAFCRINGGTAAVSDTVTALTINADGTHTSQTLSPAGSPYTVVCNKASDISITSLNGAVLGTGLSAVTGFDHFINYSVAVGGAFMPATLNGNTATTTGASAASNEALGSTTKSGPGAGAVTVSITTATTANPLQQGSYADTLTLAITPQ